MRIVNKPKVSRFMAGTYMGLVVFIAACIVFFSYAGFFTPMGVLGLVPHAVHLEKIAVGFSLLAFFLCPCLS